MKIKKGINTLIRGLFLGSLLILLIGCSSSNSNRGCFTDTCEPVSCNVCPGVSKGNPEACIDCECYTLHKHVESSCAMGDNVEYTYRLTARVNLVDITLTDTIAEGASYVSSRPEATMSKDGMSWHFDSLASGESQTVKAVVKTEICGILSNCAIVTATPIACTSIFVGAPELEITKCGPKCVCLGDTVTFEINVTNKGDFAAECVMIRDIVPPGLSHRSGKTELVLDAGTLCPGESTCAKISFCAEKGGEHCNVARVEAGHCPSKEARACVMVVEPGVAITKMGPSSLFLGRSAEYTITVMNTGTAPLCNIKVVDNIPEGTSLMSAPGAYINNCCDATWTIDCLAPGESTSMNLSLCAECPCCCTNKVTVTGNSCNCCVSATDCVTTEWKGHAALLLETVDVCDPLMVGECTDYIIRVTNQGTAADTNIGIRATFPEETTPLRANGPAGHDISGKTVTFDTVSVLEAGSTICYRITAKAVSKGDAHLNVELTSDVLNGPIVEQESTQVY